jgi:histidine triad (HIT) family protein
MHEKCIFCDIAAGTSHADIVLETDDALVFHDANPQAPTHLLAIPKKHVPTLNDADPQLIAALFEAVKATAANRGFADTGYRTVINTHRQAGQSVWHLHIHILAGRAMRLPLG